MYYQVFMKNSEIQKMLRDIVKNIPLVYMEVEGIPKGKIKKQQVERCFAYEFYHQWRHWLESHNCTLLLNGEIPKYYDNIRFYPDMVLHGGQNTINDQHQVLICEIKRKDGTYPSNKDLANDLEKLWFYIKNLQFKYGIFILCNSRYEDLVKKLKKIIQSDKNKRGVYINLDEIKNDSYKIICGSVNKDEKGKLFFQSETLEKILNS